MTATFRPFLAAAVVCSLMIPAARANDPAPTPTTTAESEESSEKPSPEAAEFIKLIKSIDWSTSGSGDLGGRASLAIPDGYRFTGGPGTIQLMEAYGNLTNGMELGYITPNNMEWFAMFEFSDVGYVKDDEKDKLDANSILDQLREGQKEANKQLSKLGKPTLEVLGWQTPPFYNKETNNLEWAIRLASSDGSETINYKTKLLGRRGVMDVVLVCDEEHLATVVPEYQKLLKGFSYNKDENYAAFTKGDKIAKYGLTGLIVGGTLLAAAKSGLLVKLIKPIAIGFLALLAFARRILASIKGIFTGRTDKSI